MIGSGFMGKAHSCAYNAIKVMMPDIEGIQCHSIATKQTENHKEFTEHWGWQTVENDWKKVVSNPEIDVIDICVPGFLHYSVTIEALRHGKHVICEKPLAMTTAQAEEMAVTALSSQTIHGVSFNYRFLPAIKLAKGLIAKGKLGSIRHFRACYLQDWLVNPEFPMTWRLRKETAGSGVHGDLNAHIVDLARHLVGEIAEVSGLMKTFINQRPHETENRIDDVTVDDACAFLAHFNNGAIGTFESSRMATGRKNANCLEIYGEKGAIKFDLERLNELEFYDASEPEAGFRRILATENDHPWVQHWWPSGHILGWQHSHAHLLYEFLKAVQSSSEFQPSFKDGLASQKVLDAVELSANQKKWVHIE
nr:Gfo/Idh/MocA family oxidoreductase [Sansalvadorimonas sp. 2012CJ34-2]